MYDDIFASPQILLTSIETTPDVFLQKGNQVQHAFSKHNNYSWCYCILMAPNYFTRPLIFLTVQNVLYPLKRQVDRSLCKSMQCYVANISLKTSKWGWCIEYKGWHYSGIGYECTLIFYFSCFKNTRFICSISHNKCYVLQGSVWYVWLRSHLLLLLWIQKCAFYCADFYLHIWCAVNIAWQLFCFSMNMRMCQVCLSAIQIMQYSCTKCFLLCEGWCFRNFIV